MLVEPENEKVKEMLSWARVSNTHLQLFHTVQNICFDIILQTEWMCSGEELHGLKMAKYEICFSHDILYG